MSAIAGVISIAVWVIVARHVARAVTPFAAERFFIFVAALSLQLGVIAEVLSLFNAVAPGPWLIAQALFLPILFVKTSGSKEERERWTGKQFLAAMPVVIFVLVAMIEQARVPVGQLDDRGYHASRVCYWMEHNNLWSWKTHNDRQILFPFGGELYFFLPVMFTRAEMPGRMLFQMALPLSAVGIYLIARQLGRSRVMALLAAGVFVATPAVYWLSVSLAVELWESLFALSAVLWGIRLFQSERKVLAAIMLGVSVILAISVKSTALPMLAAGLILVIATRRRGAMFGFIGGCVATIVLSGVLIPWVTSARLYGSILGSTEMCEVHEPDRSAAQMLTHLARVPIALMELPIEPESIRTAIEGAVRKLSNSIGADRRLALESEERDWPGVFRFSLHSPARRYSLPGVLWLPALVVAVVLIARRRESGGLFAITLIEVFLFAGLVFGIRWMGFGPERFWIPAYAVAVVLGTVVMPGRHPAGRVAICVIVAWTMLGAAVDHVERLQAAFQTFLPQWEDEPYDQILPAIPLNARILFIASQSATDYPLFGPQTGYSRVVIPWGTDPFDSDRFERVLRENKITHVIVEHPGQLEFGWHPAIDADAFLDWMARHESWEELRSSGSPRAFAVRDVGVR